MSGIIAEQRRFYKTWFASTFPFFCPKNWSFCSFCVVCQKLFGALFPRVVDQLLCGAFLHHHTAVHKQDAVGHIPGKVHLVGHDDHGGLAVSQFPQHPQHLAGQFRVKGAGGLVEAEDVRVQRQRPGLRI